jgi:uncharacterized protein YggU (UPF0235/DUF167 family)
MIINVKAKPNSKKDEINKIDEKNYEINVRAKPEDNKANISIVKLLSKYLNVSQKKIRIKNPTSRNKIVEIIED